MPRALSSDLVGWVDEKLALWANQEQDHVDHHQSPSPPYYSEDEDEVKFIGEALVGRTVGGGVGQGHRLDSEEGQDDFSKALSHLEPDRNRNPDHGENTLLGRLNYRFGSDNDWQESDQREDSVKFSDVPGDDSEATVSEDPINCQDDTLGDSGGPGNVGDFALGSEQGDSSSTASESVVLLSSPPRRKILNSITINLPRSTLLHPPSLYDGFVPPAPLTTEVYAVQQLTRAYRQSHPQGTDFIEFDLDQFTMYAPIMRKDNDPEMKPLQYLSIKMCNMRMLLDGVLSFGDQKFFVKGVWFEELPLGNYGIDAHTVGDHVWVRSLLHSRKSNEKQIYYKLKSPSLEYARMYEGAPWLFDFAKHFADYIIFMSDEAKTVSIHHFQSQFSKWAHEMHGHSPAFQRWWRAHGNADFRTAVTANQKFLWKESCGVLTAPQVRAQIIWKEILFDKDRPMYRAPRPCVAASLPFKKMRGAQEALKILTDDEVDSMVESDILWITPTVVTPYIFECFSHLPCGMVLEQFEMSDEAELMRNRLIHRTDLQLPLHIDSSPKAMEPRMLDTRHMVASIKPGDVISVERDGPTTGTEWKREVPEGCDDVDTWFGLVQAVRVLQGGKRVFDLIWFYRPVDTPCLLMKYPWSNELFLSQHCNCNCDRMELVDEDCVLGVHEVEWHGTSTTKSEFFCRQTYMFEDCYWITLQESHFRCEHYQLSPPKRLEPRYRPGDTVLVEFSEDDKFTEPCEIIRLYESDRMEHAEVRRLLRRKEVDPEAPDARPNELVYSDRVQDILAERIKYRCVVRVFDEGETLPAPYGYNGVGNVFFMTRRQVRINGKTAYVSLKDGECISLRQGFDPATKIAKLRGLDLFCGGGNFGRGLEDGGAFEVKWANDLSPLAIHTYMANSPNVQPFLGSIDEMQYLAIKGRFSDNVPKIGDVDFISAGSPCPGFSQLTNDKTAPHQRKNQSLVAAFASFVDVYRPKYGLLENVPRIVQSGSGRTEDVFSQLICAIVGLGYQTRGFQLDSWSHGNAQSRSRVFLCFSAPNVPLPECPRPSHSHPPGKHRYELGKLSTGQAIFKRTSPVTPFKYVTIKEATQDLPSIIDAKADLCVRFPDHRSPVGVSPPLRTQFSLIPTLPRGMNLSSTWNDGKGAMTEAERKYYPDDSRRVTKESNGWGRVKPDQLLGSVTCTVQPTDWKVGRQLHWDEYRRPISIMEARRAQGFRDEDVILGEPSDQIRTIGNSVAREVSVALGLAFREAWVGSLVESDPLPPRARYREASVPLPVVRIQRPSSAGSSVTLRNSAESEADNRTPSTPFSEVSSAAAEDRVLAASMAMRGAPLAEAGGPSPTGRKRRISIAVELLPVSVKMARLEASAGSAHSSRVQTPLKEWMSAEEFDDDALDAEV